ncbi:MAG: ribonuclease P protein component [Candidatus Sulfotelmatobacter sp.]
MTASVSGESNPDVDQKRVEQQGGRSYPHNIRLLRHADFERVYKQGRRHFSTSLTVFYLLRQPGTNSVQGLRIGFTVSRALGGAVQRNRMRRRLREAVRLCRPLSTPDVDVVINPKKVLLTVEFEGLLNEVRRAFVVVEKATLRG